APPGINDEEATTLAEGLLGVSYDIAMDETRKRSGRHIELVG
ncbi:hypothetical protein A2U01_0088433, partial [Trifolium medium]|nr:hypothetical protein [Trifolium medium]